MKGRILGCATNKYIRFVADTGTPVTIVLHSLAVKNKLEVLPRDKDEPSYAGVTGMKLSVVGQCTMYINFKTMKTTDLSIAGDAALQEVSKVPTVSLGWYFPMMLVHALIIGDLSELVQAIVDPQTKTDLGVCVIWLWWLVVVGGGGLWGWLFAVTLCGDGSEW